MRVARTAVGIQFLAVIAGPLLVGCATTAPAAQPQHREVAMAPAPASRTNLPTVAIITTGGTIAMTPDAAAGGAVPTLTGEALVAAVPELREIANLRVLPLVNIDSRQMTPELWLRQARLVGETLDNPAVAGVVITHGTDTMEESAYFLDRTLRSDKPVVLTGAQRDATARDADGPRNLLNAVRQVVDRDARGRGVTITFNGCIYAARPVTKSHASNVAAFDDGNRGLVGEIDDLGVRWFNRPERAEPYPLPAQLPKVELVYCYPGADGALIDCAAAGGAQGVVVAGYGIGNVNDELYAAIERARRRGVHVVLTTRVREGRVYPVYGGAGGGASLRQLGVVFGSDLLPWKARIELMLARTVTDEVAEIQRRFDEQPGVFR